MNRNVAITGATSGIGEAFAELFAGTADNLLLIGRNEDNLRALAERLRAKKTCGNCRCLKADLSRKAEVEAVCADLRGGDTDILVNNAGFGMAGAFLYLDGEREEEMMYLNMTALTKLTRAAAIRMAERRRGRILNVASIASFMPNPYGGVYAATKAYVRSFSEALAEELKGTGVTVSVLCPGPTRTNFGRRSGMDRTAVFAGKVMTAGDVAKIGCRGMMRGKLEIVPGFRNRVTAFLGRTAPKKLVLKTAADTLRFRPEKP